MLKGIVDGFPKDIIRIPMWADGVEKEGWEVRDSYGDILWGANKTLTGADSISFEGYGLPLKAYDIEGNMVQAGTPAPDNKIMPDETGDKTANLVNISDDNLLTYSTAYNGFTVNGTNQTVTITGNALFGFLAEVNPSTQYTIYARSTEYGMIRIREYTEKPTAWASSYIQQDINSQVGGAYTITTAATAKYICVAFYFEANHAGAVISNVMLNTGSSSLPYEPYGYKVTISCGGETKTIYLREPLRKIGDYADTISSDGTVTRNIVKIDLSALTWGFITSSNYAVFWANYRSQLREDIKGVSNTFDVAVVGSFSSLPDLCMRVYEGSASQQRLAIRYDALNGDTDALYQALDGAYLWAVLETPATETATVPTITTAKGSNTLAIGTALAPSKISITGHIKPA